MASLREAEYIKTGTASGYQPMPRLKTKMFFIAKKSFKRSVEAYSKKGANP